MTRTQVRGPSEAASGVQKGVLIEKEASGTEEKGFKKYPSGRIVSTS